ncbi:unnamed protein product [Urochloa decumbens]|uniref:Uncharacterized protein n=1 Tax=Urochloa decumbens TaxID=240449 RepID=A0ABC8XQS7_9POAL
MAADRVHLSRDDTTISLLEISRATAAPDATVGFRIVVVQCYRAVAVLGDPDDDDVDADTMEDVSCRVPVAELIGDEGEGAAAVGRAFEALVSRLDHPTLIPAVAPEARKAAAHVRAVCAAQGVTAGGDLAGAEFRLRLVFVDPLEEESEPDSEDEGEEVGSDLELDDECCERGMSESDGGEGGDTPYEHGHVAAPIDGGGALVQRRGESEADGGAWRYEVSYAALSDDEDEGGGGGQFTARPFGGAMAREGGPSDGTLLLSGFEARADGNEEGDQHELTPRDVRRLVRLAFGGGDVVGDEAYQRAMASGGDPVSPATRAAMLEQALRSARPRAPPATAASGMPPGRMRTGL